MTISPNRQNELLRQLNKRLSLNLLIQGAATHTCMSAHHLVRDQLETLQPGTTAFYDKLSATFMLTQWLSEFFGYIENRKQFWSTIADKEDHPFSCHPLLVKHGSYLSSTAFEFQLQKAKDREVGTSPLQNSMECIEQHFEARRFEFTEHRKVLQDLAENATSQIWGIDQSMLKGVLTEQVEFGNLQQVETYVGELLRAAAAGYGGVIRKNDTWQVHARAWNFTLLLHELSKGTAELVCLHGLNDLDDETYQYVTRIADQIELEVWMIQAGGELWRMFLAAIPKPEDLAEALMKVALLSPESLEQLLMDLIEHPLTARATIADMFDEA